MSAGSDASPCLDEPELLALFTGSSDGEERARLEAHLDLCSACRQIVAALARSSWIQPRDATAATSVSTLPALQRGMAVGRYLLLDQLGEGGMGVVYAAYDSELEREVALKLLRATTELKPDAQERLKQEARVMAQLEHENIVRVYDLGVSDGRLFLAMEMVRGRSLRHWLQEPRPWRQVLDVFRHAGAGLAAAHARQLIHGDFKPDNILMTEAGRICVADFGLAGSVESPLAGADGRASAPPPAGRVTWSGVIRGTPPYIAPELWQGANSSEASDQFAFCVALYEALWGARPFDGASLAELAANMCVGRRATPRKAAGVPAWLEAAVARGLDPDPTKRFGSMGELLAKLGHETRRRRRLGLGVAAAMLVAGASSLWLLGNRPAPCAGAEEMAAEVWGPAAQTSVEAALRSGGDAAARQLWPSVRQTLDDYVTRWTHMRTDACRATVVRHEQSEELLERRLQCLDGRLLETRALVDLLRHADASVAEHAQSAVVALPSIDACADTNALSQLDRPPRETAAARAQVERELATIHEMINVGQFAAAMTRAQAVIGPAKAVGYAPQEAEALVTLAELEHTEDEDVAARRAAFDGLRAAESGKSDLLKARAALLLGLITLIDGSRADEGLQWMDVAEAAIDRLPEEREQRIRLLHFKAEALLRQRRYAEATTANDLAFALAERYFANRKELAAVLETRAYLLMQDGRLSEAHESIERARAIWNRQFGNNREKMIELLEVTGELDDAQDHYAEALAVERQSMALTGELGQKFESQWINAALNTGNALFELHRFDEAQALVQRALDQAIRLHGDGHDDAAVGWGLLCAAAGGRKRYEEALRDCRHAESIYRRLGDATSAAYLLSMRADLELSASQPVEALRDSDAALHAYEQHAGRDHAQLMQLLLTLGKAQLAAHAQSSAIATLERALALSELHPQLKPDKAAEARLELAQALWRSGGDRTRALELARAASDYYRGQGERLAEKAAASRALVATLD